ncbi:acetolactate decarboxylase [Lactobacillus equicursoris]|uniref:acetolactate decarboxylase n=1 Tax=Lactobacillus equicursoris TaxID=420645 RepID=UPI00242EC62E|nr:acetolactate decarboxylase [Lactobacillus equicursoris]MDD6386708.1 acetolactate decarboxylase [Lactobacillus equicursoris]
MKEDTVYQHGTLAMLISGLFDGTLPVSSLLEHGDSGIGTCAGLDGEMVILGGHAYTIRRDGTVEELAGDVTVPFACVHFDEVKNFQSITNLSVDDLEAKILQENSRNVFFAVKITGTFAKMTTRTVFKQEKPYPGLVEVADQQAIFTGEDTKGTVIGYYAPDLYQGVASSGFHLHYLSDNHQLGGHILDMAVKDGELTIQPFVNFNLHLPVDNADFLKKRIDTDQLNAQIRQAEH